jgi:uncharacterized protein
MLPFIHQVQIAADQAKGATARLAGVEVPKYDDTEKTFADLKARLIKTVAFVQSARPKDVDRSEDREINLTLGEHTMSFKGQPYLVHFVMPNFYFYCTTAYDILRHCSVELGNAGFHCDYLIESAQAVEERRADLTKELSDRASRPSAAPCRLDSGDVDFLHFHHRIESALCFLATSRKRVGQHARRDLPGNSPLIFAPPALALLSAITDDCVPVAVRLFLIFGRDLKREGFVMLEYGTAVEAETGYAEDREFNHQRVALLSARIVARRMVHGADIAIGEGRSIEAGRSLGVLVVPQTNCVLGHCLALRFGKYSRPIHKRNFKSRRWSSLTAALGT